MTEIRFLPEDTSPQPDDWLLVQKADTNADKKISIENLSSTIQLVQTSLNKTSHPGFVPGRYYSLFPTASGVLNQTASIGFVYYTYLYIPIEVQFSAVAVLANSGTASSKCRLGIYNVSNGMPSSLALDCGEIALPSSGVKEVAVNFSLSVGFYFVAITVNQNNNFVAYSSSISNASILGGNGVFTNYSSGWRATFSYENFPNNAPIENFVATSTPVTWFKVA
jgi:hypothetical protein